MNKQTENLIMQQKQTQIVEIYKTYLQMSDKISDRRQSANSYFLTINTVIVGLISYLSFGIEKKLTILYFLLISIAGMVICYYWFRLIRSYKDLNSGKFKVVHDIEKLLPINPFENEWEKLGRGKDKKKYLPFTKIEMRVPWVFFFLHAIVFLNNLVLFLIIIL